MLTDSPGLGDTIQLTFFADVAKAITSASTINETLQAVMTHIGTIFAPMNWSLLLRNPRTGELTFKLVVGSGVQKILGSSSRSSGCRSRPRAGCSVSSSSSTR